ncbi:MDR family MFS transporter [Sporolactobacillus putidus]|uniref:Multidrug resistance protein 3 n=1 Tax=Sporolactobacillus putidus TaxID=492735 RepID=A0A917VZZ9_9BACL|nr:MDR family MFS transporter [Sporolactobacillus putidus]GGL51585.1 multidrug resistance protein 3 [Sporolactobacillus putidus]
MESNQTHLKLVVTGLLLGLLMAAMDNTIVATAMGTIVSDLGGFDKFVWVTAAYMVTVMAGMPIFGKLSDMYGRKRFFLFGLVVFLIGSALCGLAQNMVELSLFRAFQGIGGGALMPIAFTIVFDLFPPEKRGKMTGLFGAVFGAASVLGPLLGAYITEYLSWHWVFYVNVPIGIVAFFLMTTFYKESRNHHKQVIDWAGAVTLVISVVSLMFALELGGHTYAWKSWQIFSLFGSFAVFFVLFFIAELRAAEPILPFWLFKRRLFAASQIIAFLYGSTFVILTVFIPIFVQAVYGGSATNAGFVLMPMMLGVVFGSSVSGFFQAKTSYRSLMILSYLTYMIGIVLLANMTPDTPHALLILYMSISGFGIGFSFSLLPMASIQNLEPRYRGTANSTNTFLRSLGMTIGVAVFGSIQNNFFTGKLKDAFAAMQQGTGQTGQNPRAALGNLNNISQIFQSDKRTEIPPFILNKVIHVMSDSITQTFAIAIVPIAITIIFILLMGNGRSVVSQKRVDKASNS